MSVPAHFLLTFTKLDLRVHHAPEDFLADANSTSLSVRLWRVFEVIIDLVTRSDTG